MFLNENRIVIDKYAKVLYEKMEISQQFRLMKYKSIILKLFYSVKNSYYVFFNFNKV